MFETIGELLQKKVKEQWDEVDLRLYGETNEWGADLRFGIKKAVDTKWQEQIITSTETMLRQTFRAVSGRRVERMSGLQVYRDMQLLTRS